MDTARRTVVIVGTSHSFQLATAGALASAGAELQDFLADLCRAHQIRAVAEEMGEESLGERGSAASVPMRVAQASNLAHAFCDPGTAERARLGICESYAVLQWREMSKKGSTPETIAAGIRADHAKREAIWLERLGALDRWPTLFVCGADHVAEFQALLEREGMRAVVAAHDWEPKASVESGESARQTR